MIFSVGSLPNSQILSSKISPVTGLDASQLQSRFASFNRVAAMCELNVNRYLIQHYGQARRIPDSAFTKRGCRRKTSGRPLNWQRTSRFISRPQFRPRGIEPPSPLSSGARTMGTGDEIVSVLLGRTKCPTNSPLVRRSRPTSSPRSTGVFCNRYGIDALIRPTHLPVLCRLPMRRVDSCHHHLESRPRRTSGQQDQAKQNSLSRHTHLPWEHSEVAD